MKTKIVYIFYFVLFLLLFFFTLNFNFIEGDDATTIMYHLLGRNQELQLPYSSYHSMFDTFLSFFNADNEWLLRHVSIGVSFLFGGIMLFVLSYFVFLKSKQTTKNITIVLMLLPFIIPEMLFGSLIVNPTLISITFIIIAHILMLKYLHSNNKLSILLAILCFGIGVSFRWNNGFYLFLLFADFILQEKPNIKNVFQINRIKKSFIIFPLFILSVVVCIQISGYSLIDIFNTYTSGTAYVEEMETSYTAMLATAIAFLTPALLLLLFLGILYSFKKKAYRNILILIFALIPFAVVGLYPSYKYMISVIPVLVLIAIQGFALIEKRAVKIGFIIVLFFPWVIGVQLNVNSAWGPGFEVKSKNIVNTKLENYNPDNALAINKFKIVFGSGMAMPTPEGPRPMFGFGKVFLSDWYDFLSKNNSVRLEATKYAIQNHCTILQDVRHAFIASKLVELGYKTNVPFNLNEKKVYSRFFTKGKDSITIHAFPKKNHLFNATNIETKLLDNKELVVFSSYSNIISKLKTVYKDRFEEKSAFWGVLKVE